MFNRKWNDTSLMYISPLDTNPRPNRQFLQDYRMRIDFPPVNVEKKPTHFNVSMAAPGLKKADFKIKIEEGNLIVSAEKKEVVEEKTSEYVHQEYDYHSFRRTFLLPDNVKTDEVNATYLDGVLTIKIPYQVKVEKRGGMMIPVEG